MTYTRPQCVSLLQLSNNRMVRCGKSVGHGGRHTCGHFNWLEQPNHTPEITSSADQDDAKVRGGL